MTSDILPAGYIASSMNVGYSNFQAFDLNPLTYYSSDYSYSSLTGQYTRSIQTGPVYGDWIGIEYPFVINVMSYTIRSSVSLE